MKTMNRTLARAHKILALRNRIVADHLSARNEMAVKFVQTRATVNHHRRDIALSRLAVLEAVARARKLMPKKPVDPARRIANQNARTIANLEARASLRSQIEHQLRAQAAQAAFDRAAFISQVKQNLPEEMWDETIDTYDRRVYEASEGGSS